MPRDSLYADWMFQEQNPDHRGPEERKKKESPGWVGYDSSFEVLPHLQLDWKKLKKFAEENPKPMLDLGASYSSLAAEGVLWGVDIIPVDSSYDQRTAEHYRIAVFEHFVNTVRYRQGYPEMHASHSYGQDKEWRFERDVSTMEFEQAVTTVQEKLVRATINALPFHDRSISMTIAHDSVPKHSPDFKVFLAEQLPEILRVTDNIALLYPMAIYKTVNKKFTPESGDPEAEYKGKTVTREILEEHHALYRDSEAIQQITELAERLGYTFALGVGAQMPKLTYNYNAGTLFKANKKDQEAMLGIFKRKT